VKHTVIIGNGIAGITAARHLRKYSDQRITVISAETKYFFSRTALMYIYMGHMTFEHTKPYEDFFWEKNRIELLHDRVVKVDFGSQSLQLEKEAPISYDQLVLATGSKPNKFGWPGENLPGVQGLYSYQDLQLLEQNTHAYDAPVNARSVRHAVIVGAGLIGVELAEMLLSRGIAVTILVREDHYWGNVLPPEEARLIAEHMREHQVNLRFKTELDEIVAGENGRVAAIKTKDGETIECQLVGLTPGVRPNVDFLQDSGLETDKGILVDELLRTNQPNVFAAGDCAQLRNPAPGHSAIEPVWYTGRMMGEALGFTLAGRPTPYQPGPWFNSAKFFDIEYQVYGQVPVKLNAGQRNFYWEHRPTNQALRFVFEKESRKLLGVNALSTRLRHACFDQWLRNGNVIENVLSQLRLADFETEFYTRHWAEIVRKFNAQEGTNVKLKGFSWKNLLPFTQTQQA
jgi:NADPH-dependent 2,4-dienoyl-CoA reductase/sulfur reductase-like enzyme